MSQDQKIELGDLSDREKELIFAIRYKYQYANMTIITRSGQPFRLKITEYFEDLSTRGVDNSE